MEPLLTGLNETQKRAVAHTEGPLLVVAGAGTGKTRVLTHRIVHLMHKGVDPASILAITFTNKAAKEMRERVFSLMRQLDIPHTPFSENTAPFVGTFHALGVSILRESGKHVGIKKNFSIKDREDSLRFIKEALTELGIDKKQFVPAKILAIIGKQKGNLVTPRNYAGQAPRTYFFETITRVWERYETLLTKENALDFDDLICKTVFLLKEHKDVLSVYQKRWRYIHIDEYQDTNEAQYTLSTLLAKGHNNICVVGDGDQNIYSWRGARMENIFTFEEDFADTRTITLEENYRSTSTILRAANEIIKKNKIRKEKNLFTQKNPGEKISLYAADNEEDEAYHVGGVIQTLLSSGVPPQEIAVLYRANFQSRILEEALLALDIPYHVTGTRFFERKEVKDIIAFLNASLNTDSFSDMKRIINVPPRGIGKVALAKIFGGVQGTLPHGMRQRVENFFTVLKKINRACEQEKPSAIIHVVLKETGLEAFLKQEGEEGVERLENIKELAALASRYDTLPQGEGLSKFLSDVALASDQDSLDGAKNGVRLMTVHAAKGLEFRHVFVTGLEQGLFPHERIYGEKDSEEGEEEERRLFYVALTRAKEKLYLSLAARRMLFGATYNSPPSEFLYDIPPELLEHEHFLGEREKEYITFE